MARSQLPPNRSDADLRQHLDDLVEHCQRKALPLRDAARLLLPLIRDATGARAVALVCPDERLRDTYFWEPAAPAGLPDLALRRVRALARARGRARAEARRLRIHARVLDFSGQHIGIVAAVFPRTAASVPKRVEALLDLFAEQVDGYIGEMVIERRKQRLVQRLASALKHPVLETGIRQALRELRSAVSYSAFLLVYTEEQGDAAAKEALRVIADGRAQVRCLSAQRLAPALLRRAGRVRAVAENRTSPERYRMLRRLGLSTFVHEQLITGVRDETVLGEIILGSDERAFSTFELDLVRNLVGLLRLRLIDWNRERRGLLRSFSSDHAHRLLSESGYQRRYLDPRRRTLAIMFADIDEFTHISEEKLVRPEAVLDLVDRWSTGARAIIHRHHGVLDKIIGDCALSLFGPPFFAEDYRSEDEAVRDYCLRALRAAIDIRSFTRTLRVPGSRLAVAIGLSVAPLAVGMMRVGDSYTGYGRGMNETARLQDLADAHEILVSKTFYHRLGVGHGHRFGPVVRKSVSGVRNPLPFRMLLS